VLINRRVAYFGGLFFLLSLAFYVYNMTLVCIIQRIWPPPLGHPAVLLHGAVTALFGLQWLLCRRGRRSSKQLNLIDVGGLLGAMVLFSVLTIAEATGFDNAVAVESLRAEAILCALITLAVVVTHAIIVPATVRRTFWISVAACALLPVTAYLIVARGYPAAILAQRPWLPTTVAMYVSMWAMLTVVVATVAARVIYGLQQRVREANEIGQYTLQEKIGEGGMGVVYLARHALLRRPTAVKLLVAERAGEQAVRRFEQEVQLTSALTHPNTISIFDFGRTPDGVFYYAMEYLDGITLEDLATQTGAQPPARVVQILKQAASALSEAHEVGLVHRDIKPANLMLCVRGRIPDHVKVLDFGLVKEHDGEPGLGLSRTGALIGTPAYLAPEGILDSSSVDARADIYALGAVAYQLLVGAPVFQAKTVVEVCAHHLHSIPVPPSERAEQAIPAALDNLVLRCLAKDRAARPQTAAELTAALEALETLDGIGRWTVEDARTWWRERAPAVMAAAKTARAVGSTPGPRTVAIDLEGRGAGGAAEVKEVKEVHGQAEGLEGVPGGGAAEGRVQAAHARTVVADTAPLGSAGAPRKPDRRLV
jgi:serine/threonine-protein kinase